MRWDDGSGSSGSGSREGTAGTDSSDGTQAVKDWYNYVMKSNMMSKKFVREPKYAPVLDLFHKDTMDARDARLAYSAKDGLQETLRKNIHRYEYKRYLRNKFVVIDKTVDKTGYRQGR